MAGLPSCGHPIPSLTLLQYLAITFERSSLNTRTLGCLDCNFAPNAAIP